MATENRRSRIRIEDWSGVTTSNVIPDGQERWYDGVTGYQSTEIIRLVGDGSTTIASLIKRQPLTDGAQTVYGVKTFDDIPALPATAPTSANQATNKAYVDAQAAQTFDVEDTDSGDVAATTPSSPSDGDKWIVVNSGSSGNHVTGLPGTISLGDGKRIDFIYDATNTTWRYEDIIIDKYPSGSYRVIKYSGGRMIVRGNSITGNLTYPENFANTSYSMSGATNNPSNSTYHLSAFNTPTVSGVTVTVTNAAGTGVSEPIDFIFDGEWK